MAATEHIETSSLRIILAMGYSRCVVRSCGNTKKRNPLLVFHEFPSDPLLRTEWIKIIEGNGGFKEHEYGKVEACIRDYCVCKVHFEETCYSDAGRLKKNSTPSVFHSLISR